MNSRTIVFIVVLVIIGTMEAFVASENKNTAALSVFPILLAAFSILVSSESAQKNNEHTEKTLNLTEKALKLTETEQCKNAINESLKYFYLPVKDVLEPNCALLKKDYKINNHSPDIDENKNMEFALSASLFYKKMEALKHEYSNIYSKDSIENTTINLPREESNSLLIHLITIEEIKKVKQYRHFANNGTAQLFETYIHWDTGNLDTNLKAYLKQKTKEFSDLSKNINRDLKNHQEELNKYSNMQNN